MLISRNLTPLMFVGLFLLGAAASGAEPGDRAARPNILFCISDDQSFPHTGVNGTPWVSTPGFDRVAREGINFVRAYTPNAKCAPSRSSILTGRNSWQLKAAANHWCFFPPEFKTYAEVLAENGYFVGKTGKAWAPGVAKDDAGKPRQLAGPGFEARKQQPPTRAISNNDYAGNFEDFLAARPKDQPFCFWYGCTEPHRGYEYGTGVKIGGKKLEQIERVPGFWPDNEAVRNDLLDYALEIEHFDAHLVRMLNRLEELGELENTLVVVTADNGMPFPRVKGQEYEMSNHLPLAIRWPAGIAAPGRTVEDYVSFIDLAPTFLEIAGVEWADSGMAASPGKSLGNIFRSEQNGQVDAARDHVLIGKERHDIGRPGDVGYPIRGIVKRGMLYLENYEPERWPGGNPETGYLNCDGSPTKTAVLAARSEPERRRVWELCFGLRPGIELYDVAADPECLTNLAGSPDHASSEAALREQLIAELRAQEDPRMFGRGAEFDAYPYADPSGRGFYERYMAGEKPSAGWVNRTDFDTRKD